MKKPSLVALPVIVLCAAAVGGYFYLEHRIEIGIRAGLDDYNNKNEAGARLTYGDVSVDLWRDEATLTAFDLIGKNGNKLQFSKAVIPGIRAMDTGQDVGPQIRSFQIEQVTIAKAKDRASEITIDQLDGYDTNILELLNQPPFLRRQFLAALEANSLSATNVQINIEQNSLTIAKLNIVDLMPERLGKLQMRTLSGENGKSNITFSLASLEFENSNLHSLLVGIDPQTKLSREQTRAIVNALQIGHLSLNTMSTKALDGNVEITKIEIRDLDAGDLGLLQIAGIVQKSTEKTAVNFQLDEFKITDTNIIGLSLEVEDPAGLEAVETFAMMRKFRVGEISIKNMAGSSRNLSGGIDGFRVVNFTEGLYDRLEIYGSRMRIPDNGEIILGNFVQNIGGRAGLFATQSDYDLKGLVIRPANNNQAKPMLAALGLEEVEFASTASTAWDVKANTATGQQHIEIKNAMALRLDTAFSSLPTLEEFEKIQNAVLVAVTDETAEFDPSVLLPYFENTKLDNVTLAVRDDGLLEAALALSAERFGQPVDELRQSLAEQADTMASIYLGEANGPIFAKEMVAFLNTGGTLTLSISTIGEDSILAILSTLQTPDGASKNLKIELTHSN